jgi:hypothetical protein
VKLVFRQHAIERMFQRGIGTDDVAAVVTTGQVIESYADDTPYPSALWLGFPGGVPLHVVAADSLLAGERIILTVYRPDPAQWAPDWSTRRQP